MKTVFTFHQEYGNLNPFDKNWNWRTFTLIHIAFERDSMLNAYELHLGFLGFTLVARLYDPNNKKLREYMDMK